VNLDYQWVLAWLSPHAESILVWLCTGLIVLILVRIQFGVLSRKTARAMSESVATTIAACVPEIAAASRVERGSDNPSQVIEPSLAAPDPQTGATGPRPEMLRQLGLQALAGIDARLRRLADLGNLRIPDASLTAVPASAVGDPLLVVAPQHTVQALLAAQRVFDQQSRSLLRQRREAQEAEERVLAIDEELRQARQASATITARFEQANGRSDQADLQRLLIQEYNALGTREASVLQRQAEQRAASAALEGKLRHAADAAVLEYEAAAIPVVARLRDAWGHGETSAWLDASLKQGGEPSEAASVVFGEVNEEPSFER
jgi:hypothetical protein